MANVLVIEDYASIRRAMVLVMHNAGHTVDEAANPDEAKALLNARPHDAVICDFDLKASQTGVDIAEHIKDQNKGHPDFYLFSSTDPDDIKARSPKLAGLIEDGWIKGIYKKDELPKIVQDIKSDVSMSPDAPESRANPPGSGEGSRWGKSGR